MIADKNGGMNPVGTGPFQFREWVPNDHFTATRNPHYWRTGTPYLDEITYRPILDDESRAAALEAGNIDIMQAALPEVILHFRDNADYAYVDDTWTIVGEPDMGFIMCNLSKPPMDNLKVRQAMAMAISSAEYTKIIDKGVTPPTDQPFIRVSLLHAGQRLSEVQPHCRGRSGEGGGEKRANPWPSRWSSRRPGHRWRRLSTCRAVSKRWA